MIIDLEISLTKIKINTDLVSSIETVLQAHYFGHHYVYCLPSTGVKLSKLIKDRLSERANIALKNSYTNATENINTQKFKPRVIIHGRENSPRVSFKDDTFEVHYLYFSNGHFTPTQILCEDINDAEIFSLLSRYYLENKKTELKGLTIKSTTKGGGGENISKEYEKILEQEIAPCICITDGDKHYPNQEDSRKSKACSEIANRGTKITNHTQLDVLEIENLIPARFYENNYKDKNLIKEVFRKTPEAIPHLDIKLGIDLKWLQSTSRINNTDLQSYWSYWINRLKDHIENCDDCKKSDQCKYTVRDEINRNEHIPDAELKKFIDSKLAEHKKQCDICNGMKGCPDNPIKGYGENITKDFLDYLKNNNPSKILNSCSKWEEIAEKIMGYCISSPNLRNQ